MIVCLEGARPWKRNSSIRSPASLPICGNAPRICGGIFDFDVKANRLAEVNRELEDPKIWDDPQRAQDLGKEKKALDGVVTTLTALDTSLRDSAELFELARSDNDDPTLLAVAADVAGVTKSSW